MRSIHTPSANNSPTITMGGTIPKALVSALRTVWSEAAHQLCQMHFMKNLCEPVHRADQKLRQTLRDHLCSLPPVPDVESQEASARVEHLMPAAGTPEKKRVH